MNNKGNINLVDLSTIELIETNGGAPSKDSSLFYDVMWSIGCAARAVWDTVKALDEPGYEPGSDAAWVHRA